MTSQERHEARFQRRKAKRLERKQARCDSLGPTNKIFSYRKMFFYGKKCCNGVRWKQSVQNFEGHLFSGTATRRRTVLEQTWKPKSCSHFTLRERGMPLGVEPSQQEMVALPSKIDQWIKCQARVHCAGHYMDDYYAFFPTVDEAKLMGHEIVRRFEAAGIRVNKRKCKVIPLTKPFRFCKARFTLTETGKIKVNGSRDGVKRARRKLKLFHREFKEGKRSFFDIEQYMECQSAYYRNFNDHGRLLRLRRLYHAIFFGGGQCLESSKPGPVSA